MILLGLAAFMAAATVAVPWALYTQHAAAGNKHRAAMADVGIYVIGGIGTISIVQSHWCLIPAAVGAYIGTYIGVRRKDVEALPQ